jgi:hypothetical protein
MANPPKSLKGSMALPPLRVQPGLFACRDSASSGLIDVRPYTGPKVEAILHAWKIASAILTTPLMLGALRDTFIDGEEPSLDVLSTYLRRITIYICSDWTATDMTCHCTLEGLVRGVEVGNIVINAAVRTHILFIALGSLG